MLVFENNLGESLDIPNGDALESSYLSLISLSLLLLLLELLGEFNDRLSILFGFAGCFVVKPFVTIDDSGRLLLLLLLLFLGYLLFFSLLLSINPS